jgi:anti-anti-sigma regulatory factor
MPLNSSVRENGDITITSGDRLTIETAADFARVVRESLNSSHLVAIEFEPAMEIDITGLQILCSACRSAANSGKIFVYRGLQPQALTDLITSSGAERSTICKHNNNSTCIWFGGAS